VTTRKKAAVQEPLVPQNGKAHAHVLAGLVPGTLTEAGAYVPRGSVQRVPCDIFPGLDLKVDFLTSVAYKLTREDYEGPGDNPVERECRKLCAFVRGFEGWNFVDPVTDEPIPCPDPSDWQTFYPIVWVYGPLTELYTWLVGRGLTRALNQAMGNLQPA
jgi:hypothetical protein